MDHAGHRRPRRRQTRRDARPHRNLRPIPQHRTRTIVPRRIPPARLSSRNTAGSRGGVGPMMNRTGFPLIELLVAVAISVVLMAGVLVVTGGLSRDARRVAQSAAAAPDLRSTIDLMQWDLTNARSMSGSPDGRALVLVGHCAINPASLHPSGRLTPVTYSCH